MDVNPNSNLCQIVHMDMLDQALEASHEDTKDSTGSDDVQLTGDGEEGIGTVQNVGSSQITLDPNLQYQLRTDTGQVTYRVVQVTGDGTESARWWPQMPSSQELRQ